MALIKQKNYILFAFTVLITTTSFAYLSNNGSAYNSFVDTLEDSYFKVLNLESGIEYNFTVDVEEYYQMDLGFSIHADERPKEKNALVIVDQPGTGDESTLFVPDESRDYYIRTYSNYDWGFFEITVFDTATKTEQIVEPYYLPYSWKWLWISAIVLGGLIIVSIITVLSAMAIKRIDWGRIKIPRISIDWNSIRNRIRTRRAQRKIRRGYQKERRKERSRLSKRTPFRKRRKKREHYTNDYEPLEQSTSIIYISDSKPKCMVSGLYINFEDDDVLACPKCENIAKKPMLAEWLRVKGICPICKTRLVLENCPKAEPNLE